MFGFGKKVELSVQRRTICGSTEYILRDNEGYSYKTLWAENPIDEQVYQQLDNSQSDRIKLDASTWAQVKREDF